MKDTAIIMYSHSEYSDVWQMFFDQTDKYMPADMKRYVFADKGMGKVPNNWTVIEYDPEDSYARRVSSCVEQIKEEYCIFHHEDMPLYKEPDLEKLSHFHSVLENDEEISYIKMVRGGLHEEKRTPQLYSDEQELYNLDLNSYFLFAVQPTLWKTESFHKVYKFSHIKHISEFEMVATEICKYFKIKGLYYYGGEDKRGEYHWDSSLYPYIATAIVKGKWNVSEYYEELIPLTEKYNINVYERGIA